MTPPCPQLSDDLVNALRTEALAFVENSKPKQPPNNLTAIEAEGYEWLKEQSSRGHLAITVEDKGGAMLLMNREDTQAVTLNALSNTASFEDLGPTDPDPKFREKLLSLWKSGIRMDYVSPAQAKKAVSLLYKDGGFTLSTSDLYKPGTCYAYPLFKVHKMSQSEITNKVIPPANLLSNLSNGTTTRSDKFLAWRWLTPLQKDYSKDLIKDSTSVLQVLESLNGADVRDDMYGFNLDVKPLYDSLNVYKPRVGPGGFERRDLCPSP